MTSSGQVPVAAILRGLRAAISNWWYVGPLGWVVMPSRLPPRRGLLGHPIARRTVTVRLRGGGVLRCRVDELWAVAEVFALRTYDRTGVRWSRVRTIIDIGANIGAATVWLARRAPNARIVAVEPSPSAVRLLRENVRRNHLGHRVVVVAAAVGAAPGRTRIADGGLSVSGRTSPETSGVEIPVLTIDHIAAAGGLHSVDIIKIDCEGAEYDAFRGASAQLMGGVSGVIGEYHATPGHTRDELRALLEPAGLQVRLEGGTDIGSMTALRPTAPVPG